MAFEFPIRIYWEDTDAGGIVYYANYFKFFERARTEWLRARGLGQQALKDGHDGAGGMFVVAQASARYVQPARLDDLIVVTAAVQHAGRAGLTLTQQAWRLPAAHAPNANTALPAQRELLCDGSVRVGWVDARTLKPMRIPPDILEKLAP